jgi:hypothetical protein
LRLSLEKGQDMAMALSISVRLRWIKQVPQSFGGRFSWFDFCCAFLSISSGRMRRTWLWLSLSLSLLIKQVPQILMGDFVGDFVGRFCGRFWWAILLGVFHGSSLLLLYIHTYIHTYMFNFCAWLWNISHFLRRGKSTEEQTIESMLLSCIVSIDRITCWRIDLPLRSLFGWQKISRSSNRDDALNSLKPKN